MIGKVVVGVRLSHIPTCFTVEDCVDCNQILRVKVVESQVNLRVNVLYVPTNVGQFYLEFETDQVITNFIFTYSVQINPDLQPKYRSCFTTADFAQLIVRTVETATLTLFDNSSAQNLTLEDLDEDSLGIPAEAQRILA